MSQTLSTQPVKPSLGERAAQGFLWSLVQAICSKAIGIVGQVILAWLLAPDDFGLIGLAYTVTAFTNLIARAGIREVLIHRHRQFRRWATPAFWMSLAFGGIAMIVMIALAPLAAWAYSEPRLIGLILVLAIATPLTSASMVPHAALQSQLRFGLLARLGIIENVGQMGLTILFALLGLGAYSFVIPRPVIALLHLVVEWYVIRPPVRLRLQWSRWRFLLGDSAAMLFGSAMIALTTQGDYIVLGALFPAATVGLYFFSFNLAMQTIQMLTVNLSQVMFPTLSSIDGIAAQTNAFLKACKLISLIGTPLALLQIAIAEPVIHLLFAERWQDSVPLIQVLSIATTFQVVLGPGGSLMQAQGRFRFRLVLFGIYAPIFLLCVYVGAVLHGAIGASVAVSSYYIALGVFHLWLVIRPGGGHLSDAWRVYGVPILAASFAATVGWYAAQLIPERVGGDIMRIITTTVIMLGLYAGAVRWLLKGRTDDLIIRIRSLYRKKVRAVSHV